MPKASNWSRSIKETSNNKKNLVEPFQGGGGGGKKLSE